LNSSKRAHLIANSKSGKGGGATLAQEAKNICDELGWELVIYDIASGQDFERQSEKAVAAAQKDGGVVIAAGGDGTIRGVAQVAHGKNVKFAAVPCGTFNFFARNHRIPEDPPVAFRIALTGNVKPVRLGKVNGHVFLINASLGLYAKAIREREMRTSRYGRNRLVVILSTVATLLSKHLLLSVYMIIDGQEKIRRTPMIFIGNNALQLRDLAMEVGQCMKLDKLAVVMMKPVSTMETARIILRGVTKTIEKDEKLETFCADELTISTNRHHQTVALDGELIRMQSPFKIEAVPGALNLVVPTPEMLAEAHQEKLP